MGTTSLLLDRASVLAGPIRGGHRVGDPNLCAEQAFEHPTAGSLKST
ncbi:hypothetical protein [Rhodococcus sp. T7]|nr:hypothetical protein [Rhodococcus sp. T7]